MTAQEAVAQAKFEEALALHRQGQLSRAETIYAEILRQQPNHFDALHMLGVVALQTKRTARSAELMQRAIAINPKQPSAYSSLGNALNDLKRYDEALASYDKALALSPDFAEAYHNRGIALTNLKRHDEALASYDKAIALRPDLAEAYHNRGIALIDLKRYDEALASHDKAIALKPDYAEAHSNRGRVLRSLKRYDEALASYDKAIALRPNFADAYNNRGNALRDLKRHEDALASYDKAITLKPDFAAAYRNRGHALRDLMRHEDAIASYDKALALEPNFAGTYNSRGYALRNLKRYSESAASFARALQLQPDLDYAAGNKLNAQTLACDWDGLEQTYRQLVADVRQRKLAVFPFTFLAVSSSSSDQLICAQTISCAKHPAASKPLGSGQPYQHEKVRIAYLSADFHDHPTAYLMAGLFESHDTTRFEVYAYSFGPNRRSEMRDRLKQSFHEFVDVTSKSDEQVAQMLRIQEIDIAIDLKGYTKDQMADVFAYRAAPLQVNYLVYPGTMGAEYIDYIVGDAIVIPPEHEAFYSEKIVRLPDSYQVNDRKRVIADRTPDRAELNLPENGFVFCSFNNHYKIMPDVFDIWMRLLKRVDGSVLWLIGDNSEAAANLRREAQQRDVAPERLVFAPRMALPEHLARHRLANLFLDTLPYNAHTTASDALWAGLPVVTCMGNAFAGRVAASLLEAIGLPELITTNLADYEALALRLAITPELLEGIRAKLAVNRLTYPLFDTDRFRRHIERAYQTMYERYQRGLPPESFSVAPIS